MTGDNRETPDCGAVDCEAAVRRLWDFLDGELGDAEMATIHQHLEACVQCRAHADFEQRLVDELASLRREHTDADVLRARVAAALQAVARGHDYPPE